MGKNPTLQSGEESGPFPGLSNRGCKKRNNDWAYNPYVQFKITINDEKTILYYCNLSYRGRL